MSWREPQRPPGFAHRRHADQRRDERSRRGRARSRAEPPVPTHQPPRSGTSGTLDRTLGGPNIFPYIDPDLFEKSSRRDWPGKPDDDASTWRRSLYVFSKRSIRYPLFETFDQPNLINSVDRRNRSTVAPQALLLMNNAMVLFQAKKFAERVRAEAGDEVERQVTDAFRLALGRLPDRDQTQKSVAFIRGGQDGLTEFCHALFNLNEFVYRP